MTEKPFERLGFLCNVIPPLLHNIEEEVFSAKPDPRKWSRKEIIGHLIDSAANNHQRFVRGQFELIPRIVYDQDNWNTFGHYHHISGHQVIAFWTAYNKQLLALIMNIPPEKLQNKVDTGDGTPHTLAWLISDYVNHMEHHLRQVLVY